MGGRELMEGRCVYVHECMRACMSACVCVCVWSWKEGVVRERGDGVMVGACLSCLGWVMCLLCMSFCSFLSS